MTPDDRVTVEAPKGFEIAYGLVSSFWFVFLSAVVVFAATFTVLIGYLCLGIDPAVWATGDLTVLINTMLNSMMTMQSEGQLPTGVVAMISLLQFVGWVFVAFGLTAIGGWLRAGRVAGSLRRALPDGYGFRSTTWVVGAVAVVSGLSVGWSPGWLSAWLSENMPWLSFGALEMVGDSLQQGNTAETILFAVVIGLIGPISEELVFRGFFWDAFRRWMSGPVVVVLTAAIFAAFHLDPVHVIPVFFIGLFLSFIRYTSGSIVPAIIVHVINNSVGVGQALVGGSDAGVTGIVAFAAGVVALCMAGVAWYLRRRPQQSSPSVVPLEMTGSDTVPVL